MASSQATVTSSPPRGEPSGRVSRVHSTADRRVGIAGRHAERERVVGRRRRADTPGDAGVRPRRRREPGAGVARAGPRTSFSSTDSCAVTLTAVTRHPRVGVVGSGLMGSGIAEVCARAGLDVIVREVDAAAAEAGQRRLVKSLDRARRRRQAHRGGARRRAGRGSSFTTDLDDFADRQLVVEAVVEDEASEGRRCSASSTSVVADPTAILASNTSSIPIMKLGIATGRPEQVIGIHFFNPVPVLRAGRARHQPDDVAGDGRHAPTTSPPTCSTSSVIRSQDRAGFIVNALLDPVPAVGDPDDGVGLRHRRRHRHRHGRGLQPPDGAAPPRPT